jgi:hypothetical protein
MNENIEKVPIDARLLSDAIIELNISRRNVSIYPLNHPSVDKSLSRAFEFVQKLFEMRPEITLAVAKDTLIIDNYYLDKKNPVYREFALQLSNLNIASVTFLTGLTKEELYKFHRFVSAKTSDSSKKIVQETVKKLNLNHIRVGFIDFGAFAFEADHTQKDITDDKLWERYVYGMLEGTLQHDDIAAAVNQQIPPKKLAQIINESTTGPLKEESYDQVVSSYIRRSSESKFSSEDLKRLLDFIGGLKPELKKQFLSSTVRTVSKDMEAAYKALNDISLDEIFELLNAINEQKVVIPEALKNLLDKLSGLQQSGTESVMVGDSMLVDDIFLSPDIVSLLGEGDFKSFVEDAYQRDIQKLLSFTSKGSQIEMREMEREYSDEIIEKDFNQVILELLPLVMHTEEEYQSFINLMKDQVDLFVWTGQYGQIVRILRVLTSNAEKNVFPAITSEALRSYHSDLFIRDLIESFRIVGRQMREEAWTLCEYLGDHIISPLLDALISEESQIMRRFFVSILIQFGDRVIPEVIKRLGDIRWYVKRNMLYILSECKSSEVLPYIRPYCRHENVKVSVEAVKCLLNAGDSYGVAAVRDYLSSESFETVEQGIVLVGNYRIRKLVPELLQMLKKRWIGGADISHKIRIVKTLGEIGDTSALEVLRDLVTGRSILFKGVTEKLKEEIYGTLKNYPLEDVRDLIEAGMRSKNTYIREESLRLSRPGSE